tara:strand:- start:460 stop:1083 length:624 start_codon:yes stop_codon:yes gene_type:complete
MKQTYFNIPGWFNYSESYDVIVDNVSEDGVIVEIGSFLGRSTHYLATSLMNANKEQVKIYSIDTFKGSSEHSTLKLPEDFYHIYRENLKFFIGREMVIPVQGRSDDPAILAKFEDESIDYMMVDGAHEYEPVLSDIQKWWPKMKHDGVMLGDDFTLESVSEAVKKSLPIVKAPSYGVNQSMEQTWYASKSGNHTHFEKRVPGTNCLV